MIDSLTVVCWLWGEKYSVEHVNKLYNSVSRNLKIPFNFVCITDRDYDVGFDKGIRTFPIWNEFIEYGFNYRRLKLLSTEMEKIFTTEYILQIDIDMVITGDFTDLIAKCESNFKIWRCPSPRVRGFMYNTSFMLFKTGSLDHIYREFKENPANHIKKKASEDWPGTDQAIISLYVHPAKTWDESDGIYSVKRTPELLGDTLPEDVIIAGFYSRDWEPSKYTHLKWVRENWR